MENTTSFYNVGRAIKVLAMLIILVCSALPFYFMILSAFKEPSQWIVQPPTFFTLNLTLANFTALFHNTMAPFALGMLNSFKITILTVVGTVLSSSLCGFAMARMQFPGKKVVFGLLMSTFALPGLAMTIPQFLIWVKLGAYNTQYPLWVGSFFGNVFNMFLIMQFFKSIPTELEESALVDGANWWQIYWRIGVPLIKPILITIALFAAIGSWDDLTGPLIYINDMSKQTITFMIALFATEFGQQNTFFQQMAASCLSVIPVVVLYGFSQRYFMQAVMTEGIKG